jgi:hypothetical protein
VITESKLLLEADADEDEADHVGEQVDEPGVQPGAALEPPRLVSVHDLPPVEASILLQPAEGWFNLEVEEPDEMTLVAWSMKGDSLREGRFLRGGGRAEERVLRERLEGEAAEVLPADAVAAAARAVVVEHDRQEHGHVRDHHRRHQPRPVVPLVRRLVVVVERRRLLRRVRVRRGRGVVSVAARVVPPRRRLDPRRRRRPARLHVGVRHRLISNSTDGTRSPLFRLIMQCDDGFVRLGSWGGDEEDAGMTTGDSVSEEVFNRGRAWLLRVSCLIFSS